MKPLYYLLTLNTYFIMNVLTRAQAPTPKFFRVLRNIGLSMAAVGAALVSAPAVLPAAIVTAGIYLTVGGGLISAISQLTTADLPSKTNYHEQL